MASGFSYLTLAVPSSPAVLSISISHSRFLFRFLSRPERATRPFTATAVCLHGLAHDGLTGDSRACQRYVQIIIPIPFPIPIPIPVPVPIPLPIQSSFSQVALCLTEYPRLCLYHKHYLLPLPFPSLYLQRFFRTSISGYKHTTQGPCGFSSFCLLCCFTPEATHTTQPHKRRSRIASTTHRLSCFLSIKSAIQSNPYFNYHYHNNIPGNSGHAFTHTHTRPGIYTRGKRERGSVTRAQAHPRATTVPGVSRRWENLGFRHFDGKIGSIHRAGRITDRASAHGAARINRWHFLGCQLCRVFRFPDLVYRPG